MSEAAALVQLLESGFVAELIALGRADALRRAGEIRAFFGLD